MQHRFVQFFLLLFLLFCSPWGKALCFEGESPGGKNSEKVPKSVKRCETILPFSCCPLVFPWLYQSATDPPPPFRSNPALKSRFRGRLFGRFCSFFGRFWWKTAKVDSKPALLEGVAPGAWRSGRRGLWLGVRSQIYLFFLMGIWREASPCPRLSAKWPCRSAMWMFQPEFWVEKTVEFFDVNFRRWNFSRVNFEGALCLEKTGPNNSTPEFGPKIRGSKNSHPRIQPQIRVHEVQNPLCGNLPLPRTALCRSSAAERMQLFCLQASCLQGSFFHLELTFF